VSRNIVTIHINGVGVARFAADTFGLDISDETVKWHLKNLFSKLSAGTRKHAVDRARLLGLIAA